MYVSRLALHQGAYSPVWMTDINQITEIQNSNDTEKNMVL